MPYRQKQATVLHFFVYTWRTAPWCSRLFSSQQVQRHSTVCLNLGAQGWPAHSNETVCCSPGSPARRPAPTDPKYESWRLLNLPLTPAAAVAATSLALPAGGPSASTEPEKYVHETEKYVHETTLNILSLSCRV